MTYRVEVRPKARRYLSALPRNTQRVIVEHLVALEGDPRPVWSKRLGGDLKGRWSFRVGEYRVVYRIDDDVLVVLVLRIGPRGRVYEDAARGDG
jgi:mRNA interferase RelE/StbE